jgi:hypothetical protein
MSYVATLNRQGRILERSEFVPRTALKASTAAFQPLEVQTGLLFLRIDLRCPAKLRPLVEEYFDDTVAGKPPKLNQEIVIESTYVSKSTHGTDLSQRIINGILLAALSTLLFICFS